MTVEYEARIKQLDEDMEELEGENGQLVDLEVEHDQLQTRHTELLQQI